ncbi:DUF3786 domain-containing protein [Chloroflexota bacterium]
MPNKPLVPPDNSNYRYGQETALKLAGEKLASINIKEQCHRAGAQYKIADGKETAIFKYLNKSYSIGFPEMEVVSIEDRKSAPQRDGLLIIHYFLIADGSPLTGKSITYKELSGGTTYFPTFHKRTIEPLLKNFGTEPHKLLAAAKSLGGIKANYGDIAVSINAFSHIPLTLVLWFGDDEFLAAGSILFDSSIEKYLAAEDITVLCEIITWRLVKACNAPEG